MQIDGAPLRMTGRKYEELRDARIRVPWHGYSPAASNARIPLIRDIRAIRGFPRSIHVRLCFLVAAAGRCDSSLSWWPRSALSSWHALCKMRQAAVSETSRPFRECGGIGRRARLRIWSRKGWGFESPLSQIREPPSRPPCHALEALFQEGWCIMARRTLGEQFDDRPSFRADEQAATRIPVRNPCEARRPLRPRGQGTRRGAGAG